MIDAGWTRQALGFLQRSGLNGTVWLLGKGSNIAGGEGLSRRLVEKFQLHFQIYSFYLDC